MNHYSKTMKKYRQRKTTDSCPFCSEATLNKKVGETPNVYIIPNLTQYDLWEAHDVVDHLLVVPKRHVTSLSQLSKEERLEVMDIVAQYEPEGYNVYARGVGFVNKSVEHQHTHLIKVANKKPRATFFLRKPYLLWKI